MTTIQVEKFPVRGFVLGLALNTLWINASEVFRYFVFIMPMMRETLLGVDNVAPMSVVVFLVWGARDTILVIFTTLVTCLWLTVFGHGLKSAIAAGALNWTGIFCIFWLAMLNMNLATAQIVAIALPLAFLEMLVAALITRWALLRP